MTAQNPTPPRSCLVLYVLICASVLPEVFLQLTDLGYLKAYISRSIAYSNGAFWTGLLYNWIPNYPAQPALMFFTYAFLHTGVAHMVSNMAVLYLIGKSLLRRIGWKKFILLYTLTILGGAIGYALLSVTPRPMVGASGALFGLVGASVIWAVSEVLYERPGLETFFYAMLWPILLLSLLNLMTYWAAGGAIAWETHLGGTITGVIVAPILHWHSRATSG